MTCRDCPRFESRMEPYAPWGEVVGEVERNECPASDGGAIWNDVQMLCRWYRENIGTPGEQMKMEV